jgi:hypothetical protein
VKTTHNNLRFLISVLQVKLSFTKSFLKKAQELGGVRLKRGVESCLSDVKSLPIVATTTVPRKARLPIKRQLSSSTTAKSKRAAF